jgi:D-alanyl-D-alanine carboxypeptidase/D-alanyl-D-alanine-endopeptidase (penicillin-binding protein 4)
MSSVLKDSNNLSAESLYKTAGAVFAQDTGTSENSSRMLSEYINNLGLNSSDIKVVDGSGVSKNNIMTADFMSSYLLKLAKSSDYETVKELLASPGEGTLKNRMLYFKENLKAKTGTLSNTSAIAGYIKTRNGKVYAFDIMIQGARTSNSDKKNIEEQILRLIYTN